MNRNDRISQLPEFLLQHIQSFLPTKVAARSCLVSKPWFHAWSTRPFLHFDEPAFTSIDRETFFELVTNTLAKYDREGLSIQEFSLEVNVGEDASIVDKWLAIVLRNNVQELSFVPDPTICPRVRYLLPDFTSNSLIVLRLFRPMLVHDDTHFFRCPNLKKLVLSFVKLTDQTIQNLASCCPLLEEFHLLSCVGWGKIWVTNLFSLKIFKCSLHLSRGNEVRIEAPSLQTFSCRHSFHVLLSIVIYRNLRNFSISKNRSITDTWLRNLLSQCPLLEDLSLHRCYLFERIHIASHSLKRLSLKLGFSEWSNMVVEVIIDAPNLCFLEYLDYKLSYLSIVAPLAQKQAKSNIRAGEYENLDAEWFCKLGSLLKRFKASYLTLCASTPDTREFIAVPSLPVQEVEILNLYVENNISLPFRILVSGLFSTCHPKMILVAWYIDQEEFIRCLCNELLWRRSLNRWGSDGVRCWWNYLEDAKLEIQSNKTRGKWIQLDRKRFQAVSMNLKHGTEIRFTLKWDVAEEY